MKRWLRRSTAGLSAVSSLVAVVVLATGSAAAASARPTPGSPGVGDRLFPDLGNGGYDALHYDLALRYATRAPTQGVVGTVRIEAQATQSLSRFDLDFGGRSVGAVSVDGLAARFTRHGSELVITPARPLMKGSRFSVRVDRFTAQPTRPGTTDRSDAFFVDHDGSATAGQPDAIHFFYPCDDHPSDKASFSFSLDVPAGETAVANGDLTGRHTSGGRTIWTYQEHQPMATELTQVAVGALSIIGRGRVNGVLVRDVVPTRLLPQYARLLAVEKSEIRWMERRVGPYPFDRYGTLVVQAPLGFALETQMLSLLDTTWFELPRQIWAPVMLHELSHQWFGDSVSPRTWSDVWLNEGHATWYQDTYAAPRGGLRYDGATSLTDLMRQSYAAGNQDRAAYGPVARPVDARHLYNDNVYSGGALVLYALRQKIGPAAFQQVERSWVRTYRGRAASTDQFIALASHVSGRNLTGFLRSWLYGRTTPPMPGHPDWTVNPVTSRSSERKSPLTATDIAQPRP